MRGGRPSLLAAGATLSMVVLALPLVLILVVLARSEEESRLVVLAHGRLYFQRSKTPSGAIYSQGLAMPAMPAPIYSQGLAMRHL